MPRPSTSSSDTHPDSGDSGASFVGECGPGSPDPAQDPHGNPHASRPALLARLLAESAKRVNEAIAPAAAHQRLIPSFHAGGAASRPVRFLLRQVPDEDLTKRNPWTRT